MKSRAYVEIESVDRFLSMLENEGKKFRHCAFQAVDFATALSSASVNIRELKFSDCLFLGCEIPAAMTDCLDDSCIVFPTYEYPFRIFLARLYDAASLYDNFDISNPDSIADCYDSQVYRHDIAAGKSTADIKESLARSIHDHSISDALQDFLSAYREEDVVGIMGGHALLRTDCAYRQIVEISKTLTEHGKLMISGGGPGAMEALHLGAWLAGRNREDVDAAISGLSTAPSYKDKEWLSSAMQVIRTFPHNPKFESIGVPTWFYGHEPATPFASKIAKYFDNSIREDGILSLAKGGVVYAPGSAGTMQEIFQDAAQNHYKVYGYSSPMIFLGKDYWTEQLPVYPFLEDAIRREKYANLRLSLTDDISEVVATLLAFRP